MSRQLKVLAGRIERVTYELESIHSFARNQWDLAKQEHALSMLQIAHDALETALNLINEDSQPDPVPRPPAKGYCGSTDRAGAACILERNHAGKCQHMTMQMAIAAIDGAG
jgi:hypothetical protein